MSQTPNFKEIILAVCAAALGLYVFSVWRQSVPLIVAGEFRHYQNFLPPFLGLILAGTLFSLAGIFIRHRWLSYGTAILSTVPALFLNSSSSWILAGFLFTILLVLFAAYRIRQEKNLSLGFSLTKTLKSGLPLYFTAATLIVSLFYFSYAKGDENRAISSLLPRSTSGVLLKILSRQVQNTFGVPVEFKSTDTVDDVIVKFLESQEGGLSLKKISPRELESLVAFQRRQFSEKFSLKLKGDEELQDVVYNLMVAKLKDLVGPYQLYVPVFSALAFFTALKALTIPVYFLSLLIAFLLIKIAVFAKILKKEKEQIEVEKLTL